MLGVEPRASLLSLESVELILISLTYLLLVLTSHDLRILPWMEGWVHLEKPIRMQWKHLFWSAQAGVEQRNWCPSWSVAFISLN